MCDSHNQSLSLDSGFQEGPFRLLDVLFSRKKSDHLARLGPQSLWIGAKEQVDKMVNVQVQNSGCNANS